MEFGRSQSTGAWGQALDGTSLPELGGKAVYQGYMSCDGTIGYANESLPQNIPAHHYEYHHDEKGHWQICSVCGAAGASEDHSMKWTGDENGHCGTCAVCGYTTQSEEHVFDSNGTCEVCGYMQVASLPDTGDSARTGLWMIFALISGLTAVAAALNHKRTA